MISAIVPTLNAEAVLPDSLSALVPAAISGLVSEVVVVDGGSADGTLVIADAMGAKIVTGAIGRGAQLVAGARIAKSPWLLFLKPDTVLEPGWADEVNNFIRRAERIRCPVAAAFRFALEDPSPAARRAEFLMRLRSRLFRLPSSDQGLLIARDFYEELGGFRPLPAFEHMDLMQRIGGKRIALLRTGALTNAERFAESGLKPLKSATLFGLYLLRVPPRVLARLGA
jgi:glycosyltransferase involved in cell wall biosynthesis